MRFYSKVAVSLLFLSLMASPATQAQDQPYGPNGEYRRDKPDSRRQPPAPQALTADERLAILGTALAFQHRTRSEYDCSHFIHALYQRAGFPYEYANSSDLYAGTDRFQRVSHPQPGDLVVWRGHAGIVTSATQHAFFSLLSSGPAVNHYDSSYWKKRGVPRFFRYVKTHSEDFLSSSLR